jgi:class 3 adenylate cyclase/pimeloyl-ACP methyl ester carboxylesterase
MDFEPETRFVEVDGKRHAYQVVETGDAGIVVWFQDHLQHLDLFWTDDSVVEMAGLLAQDGLTNVFLQERGFGLSDPELRVATIDEQAADLVTVLDAERIERATLVGNISTSLPVALVAAQQPDRVHGVVLIEPWIAGPLAAPGEFGFTPDVARMAVEGYRGCVERWGNGDTLAMWDPGLATPRNRRLFAMAERCASSAAIAGQAMEQNLAMDGRDIFPHVRAPTRVLRIGHPWAPDEVVEAVADAIPGATFHRLPNATLGDSIGHTWKPIGRHVAEVAVGAGARYGGADKVLATVLFTDIVSSTDQLARLGDTAWTQVLEAHDRLLRRSVATAGGRYVNGTGDGALCEFASPAAAVECALGLCTSASELGIEIRAGVHTGECERRGDDLAGMAVHVGARVCAAAGEREVLVSRTVRDLVAGSGLGFTSRGEHELKGVPGAWELLAAGNGADPVHVAGAASSRPRAIDRLVIEASRRAPAALRAVNRFGDAAQKRRFARR